MTVSDKLQTELAKDYTLPINLGLNDGTICPKSCIEIMNQHNERTTAQLYDCRQRSIIGNHLRKGRCQS